MNLQSRMSFLLLVSDSAEFLLNLNRLSFTEDQIKIKELVFSAASIEVVDHFELYCAWNLWQKRQSTKKNTFPQQIVNSIHLYFVANFLIVFD
jgi:hypothetical protein